MKLRIGSRIQRIQGVGAEVILGSTFAAGHSESLRRGNADGPVASLFWPGLSSDSSPPPG